MNARGGAVEVANYSYQQGLATSGVHCVFKDSKGFLWICANNGLFRFDGYSFKNINEFAVGFLKYETYCIAEDPNHNIWIGTAGRGVYFFNTHSDKLFRLNIKSCDNVNINQILFSHNQVWFATNTGLVVSDYVEPIDSDTEIKSAILINDIFPDILQTRIINCLYVEPGSNSIWVGTNSFLFELDIPTRKFKSINTHNQNAIRCISGYWGEKIIASSWDGGVFVVNSQSKSFENDPFVNEINKVVGNKRVTSVVVDNQNRCWVATHGDGLYVFTKEKTGKVSFENFRTEADSPFKLPYNFIDHILTDNHASAWISMADVGLTKISYASNKYRYYTFPELTEIQKTKEILGLNRCTDNNKFWINFNRNEIALFDSRSKTTRYFSDNRTGLQLQNDKIIFTYHDKRGNLWIVYSKIGLYVVPAVQLSALLNGTATKTIQPLDANPILSVDPRVNSYIMCFYEDSKGRLWIGKWANVQMLELKDGFMGATTTRELMDNAINTTLYAEEEKKDYPFTVSPVYAIVEMGNNEFWVGTRFKGIISFKEVAPRIFTGSVPIINDQLPSDNIKCFYADKKGALWIGTNSGLCIWDKGNLEILSEKDGLSSNEIKAIVEDPKQNIWVSTSYGISKIDAQNHSIHNIIDPWDEKNNQYKNNSLVLSANGNIYATTSSMVVELNPDSADNQLLKASIVVSDIKVNNQTVRPLEIVAGTQVIAADINECDQIYIPDNHTLTLEFAATDIDNAGQLRYEYQVGKDNEWTVLNIGQHSLTLPDMAPGKYSLSIRVANSTLINGMKTIQVTYLPPYWLSKTAFVLYVILLLAIFFIYRKITILKVRQQSLIEKERYERKKLEELDKMKSDFFTDISHEFRTPLSLIINPLEKIYVEKDISDKNRERISLILKSSRRLLKLTNEMLDFSKSERNQLVPVFERCNMVNFVDDICQLFNNQAQLKNIVFDTIYPSELIEIPVDKNMVEKVIFNLLSNAFKYTPDNGRVTVIIDTCFKQKFEFVRLSVINTGDGIDKENQDKVFDRYFQVNTLKNRKTEGTGIGLWLVKSFVEFHNGFIELKSTPGIETCFDVYLPVLQDKYVTSEQSIIEEPIEIAEPCKIDENGKSVGHYSLLLIEDDEDIRNYIAEELSAGFKVTKAANGNEGLVMANEMIPDLIITDVMMPGMSGMELCRQLKQQVETSHIPIIILSAKATIDQQIEGLGMGADVYLPKPFNIDHLKTQVLRLIHLRQTIYKRFLKETTIMPNDAVINKIDEAFMQRVTAFIDNNLNNSDLNVEQLAQYLGLSRIQTYRKIKAISGLSAVEVIRTVRLKAAAKLILEGQLNFTEIAFETGFSSPSYFAKCFNDHFKKTPSEYLQEYGTKKEGNPNG
jgi:signal transduction histidine kinase/ligand-binding sensor domain-containing protein/CheY-like chemotaxis protein/AraC-like DNA-binding protein